jgi:hypothetical protein
MSDRVLAPGTGCRIVHIHSPPLRAASDPGDPASGGTPLETGFYLALWPAHAETRCRSTLVRLYGPFADDTVPKLLRLSAEYLSRAEPAHRDRRTGAAVAERTLVRLPTGRVRLHVVAGPALRSPPLPAVTQGRGPGPTDGAPAQ